MKCFKCSSGYTLLEIIVVIFILAVLSTLAIVLLSVARERARRTSCAKNLSSIGKTMFMYADVPANGGYFPTIGSAQDPFAMNDEAIRSLQLLYKGYVQDPRVFSCPSNPIIQNQLKALDIQRSTIQSSYGYDPGHNFEADAASENSLNALAADAKGAAENSDNHGLNAGQNVLITAGTVEFNTSPENVMAKMTDKNIYGLNPEIPRNRDGFIRGFFADTTPGAQKP